MVLEKTLESPLDCKEIKSVNPNENQPCIYIGRTDTKAEASVLWLPDVIGKDLDAGKDWGQEKKGTTEDEMVWWHQWLNGHEFQSTLGVGNGQGSLACCSPWGCKESDTTEWLHWGSYLESVLISFFYMQLSSFPSITYWRDCLFCHCIFLPSLS